MTSENGALQKLLDNRLGPYNSFNPVNPVQVWQWCVAMGERSPLYLDQDYQFGTEFSGAGAVAPPAMMQMWTMRDFNDEYAPGSTDAHPYQIMHDLEALGFPANVAVSYDITFHRYLVAGDRVHHYKTVVDISALKTTALGEGHFFTDRMEYLDQDGELFAEALITYFQYMPASQAAIKSTNATAETDASDEQDGDESGIPQWQTDYSNLDAAQIEQGMSLPELRIPITHKLIVGGAIATQDFIPVHHNVPAARAAAMPDIFMNILTTSGLCARYLGDWAGAGSRLQKLRFRLMAPNTPGDTMVMQGRVISLTQAQDQNVVEVEFAGMNSRGPHVMGSATLTLGKT